MGRNNAFKNRMKKMSQLAAEAKKQRTLEAIASLATQRTEVEVIEVEDDEDNGSLSSNTPLSILWDKKAEATLKKYRRELGYSSRHIRRLNKINRDAAKGTLAITAFFKPLVETVVQEKPVDANKEFRRKAEKALSELEQFTFPKINRKSEQQQLGVAEMAKYECLYHYLYAIVKAGMKKVEASEYAGQVVFKSNTTQYRTRKIRRNAEEYFENGKINIGSQGKHSKRVSVLDDEDIKRKVLEWFNLQPRAKRSIIGIKKQLEEVILPECIASNSLAEEVEVGGEKVDQLSEDCIRRKLISWGYSFKHLGKLLKAFIKNVFND